MSGEAPGRHPHRLTRLALALGVLALVAAPILRHWVSPLLAQSPLVPGEGSPVTFTSTGVITTLFDLDSAGPASSEPVEVTRTVTVTGDRAAAEAAAAEGLNISVVDTSDRTVTADGRLIGEVAARFAADRRSQALVDCCAAAVGGVSFTMAGAGNPLRFPWFAPTAPYPYLDTTLLAPVEMSFLGTDRVGGIEAYKYQQATGPTPVGTVAVPGRLVGSEQDSVTLSRAHAVNRTLWVDPTTGIVLRSAERVRESLRNDAGRDVVTLLSMTLASTPEQEAVQVASAREQGRPVLWTRSYAPTILGVLGVSLLLVGLVRVGLAVRARRLEQDFPDEWASFDDLRESVD